ncbi:leukocyte immunoglobulin-like receptor subfamily B member 3 [Trichosurus vulpecula]|uniref:leukocyte immunoglobulin-like receptor subfamily B member 3 n=1 Tax=Trichosurus vulpecula TaxID=9337 RepID=UPI00186AEFC6|nr:leukocyte immunoglobulin-like receptor subfamily B member 3 [Trichosurus vulpecula]
MTHTLSVLLCLGLCLSQRMKAQAYTLPRPSLRAENGSLVPQGKSVTFRCRGSWDGDMYILDKKEGSERKRSMSVNSDGMEAKFHIPSVSAYHAGTYYCLYRHSFLWSEPSDPLELVVTGLYDPPSLSALPSSVVSPGHDVTLHCQSEGWYNMYVLYKDGEEITRRMAQIYGMGSQATFHVSSGTSAHRGTYQCYGFQDDIPHEWSSPSNALVLKVTGTSKDPHLPQSPGHPEALTSSPPSTFSPSHESGNTQFGLTTGILTGISVFLILSFLFLFLLLCHRRCRHQARHRNGSREAEVKKTTRSSDTEGTLLEETPYAAVNDDRETEDTAVPKREDPQEVTYAQLNLHSLWAGAKDPPRSGPGEPSLYAALRAEPALVPPCASDTVLGSRQSLPPPATGTTMTHSLSVLLYLGLCLSQRMRAQADTFPKPSLRAENGSLVPQGRSVTLRCRGSLEANNYRLEKDQRSTTIVIMDVKPSGIEGKFHIPVVTMNDAGTYYCHYKHSSFWSERSDPLELVVTGWYDPPSLSAMPSPVVASGHSVTLQCQSQQSYGRYALYKDGEEISRDLTQAHGRGSQANFLIPAVNSTHEGTYRCYSFYHDYPYVWSAPSDPLVLRVTGTFSPSPKSSNMLFGEVCITEMGREETSTLLVAEPALVPPCASDTVLGSRQSLLPPPTGTTMTHSLSVLLYLGLCLSQRMRAQADTFPKPSLRAENGSLVPQGRSVTLRCRGSLEADNYRLEKDQRSTRIVTMDVKPSGIEGKFHIPVVTMNDAGTYYCHYKHSSFWSERSDPLELVVTGQYVPPSLSAMPSPVVASGHNVTLQCQSQQWYGMYALYKDGEEISRDLTQAHGRGLQANFLIPAVNSTHEGTYRCYSFYHDYPYVWSAPSDPLVLRVTGTFSPSPKSSNMLFGLTAGILTGISVFLILFFLFLFLFLCQRRRRHQARLRNGSREAEVKKTNRSSDPEEIPLEETPYAAVNDGKQTEHMVAPKREDPQEVTYAQLNLQSLQAGAGDTPRSGPGESSLYAPLQ